MFELAVAQSAANLVAEREGRRGQAQQWDREAAAREAELEQALMTLRASPTSWGAYKAAYDAAWLFGHPGTRWSARDFQKLKDAPDRREILEMRVDTWTSALLDRLEDRRRMQSTHEATLDEEIREIQAQVQTLGIRRRLQPMTEDKIRYKVPMDLEDWGYEDALQRMREISEQQAREMYETMRDTELNTDFDPVLRDRILQEFKDNIRPRDWGHIDLFLHKDGHEAWWQPALRQIHLRLPERLDPRTLRRLRMAIEHEVRHAMQTFMTVSTESPFGFPGRSIRTPEFKQTMRRTHPSFDPQSPETRAVYRKLRQEGVDPRTVNFHNLDDVEFYTDFADAIHEFRDRADPARWSTPLTPDEFTMALKAFVDAPPTGRTERDGDVLRAFAAHPFFRTLRRRAMPKWKKAVGDMAGAVDDLRPRAPSRRQSRLVVGSPWSTR